MEEYKIEDFLKYLKEHKYALVPEDFYKKNKSIIHSYFAGEYNLFPKQTVDGVIYKIYLRSFEPKDINQEDFLTYLNMNEGIKALINSENINFNSLFYHNYYYREYLMLKIASEINSLYTAFPDNYENLTEVLENISDFYLLELSENIIKDYDENGLKRVY